MSRSLEDIRLAALMLDGIELKGALVRRRARVTTDGIKVPLGLWDGSTENKTIAKALLADLLDRGPNIEQACSSSSTAARRSGRDRRGWPRGARSSQ